MNIIYQVDFQSPDKVLVEVFINSAKVGSLVFTENDYYTFEDAQTLAASQLNSYCPAFKDPAQ
jgi:hypothetical protein